MHELSRFLEKEKEKILVVPTNEDLYTFNSHLNLSWHQYVQGKRFELGRILPLQVGYKR